MIANRKTILLFLTIILTATPLMLQGQFLKKLKEKAEKSLIQDTENTIDDIFKKKQEDKSNKKEQPKGSDKEDVQTTEQPSSSNAENTTIDNSDLMVFKSPIGAFKDFVIQKFNGLPRFGSCDFYELSAEVRAYQPDFTKAMNQKRESVKHGYIAFLRMAKIHLLKDLFTSIDKTALTPPSRANIEHEVKSRKAQQLLYDFAFAMGTDETKLAYFCKDPQNNGRCQFAGWGGLNADDFTENEKYVDFTEKYLETVLAWSAEFFADGTQTVYMVKKNTNLGTYDFDYGGFWVKLPHTLSTSFGMDYNSTSDGYFHEFIPNTDYGQELLNKTNQEAYFQGKVLLKMDAERAESLINNKEKNIQLVSKVKVIFKGLDPYNPTMFYPQFKYHFADPLVEIYSDEQLTKKIGHLDFRNLTYKTP